MNESISNFFKDKSAKSGKTYQGGEGVLCFKHAEVSCPFYIF